MKEYSYLISDVDGILTDGGHYYTKKGKILKKFGSNDKDALKKINDLFVEKIIFVSADKTGFEITKKRVVKELGYPLEFISDKDRADFISRLKGKKIYMGDGIYDKRSFSTSDMSFCLRDSSPQAKNNADFILDTEAGKNVFSNLLDFLEEKRGYEEIEHQFYKIKDNSEDVIKKSVSDLKKLTLSIKNLGANENKIAEFCKNVADSYNGKNKVIFCGVGKNATLSEMICEFLHPYNVVSITLDPHRAVHGNLGILEKEDIMIVSSKSGNTPELVYLLDCLNNKFRMNNLFLIVSNPKSELKKRFKFKDVLLLNSEEEISAFSHSPQTTIFLYTAVMMILINRISEKKNLTERDYLLNHQSGEIGKKFKKLSKRRS